jgi:hypothetical protein
VEARGRVAISPEANVTGSPTALGAIPATAVPAAVGNTGGPANVAADKDTNSAAGGGNKPAEGSSKDPGSANAPPTAKSGAPGAGAAADGPGNTPGTSPARSPFPGITIQGGRLEGGTTTGIVNLSAPPRTGTLTLGNSAPPSAAPKASYGITIVSTATSGGGLPNLGVFSNEPVYTVYMDMVHPNGAPAPSWVLQYALTPPVVNPSGLVPPFPIKKEQPAFPVELLRKYVRQFVIAYAIIDKEGKLQQVSIKQTPDPGLNPSALEALSRWTFRPAEVKGSPAPVKILLGIPLPAPPQ